MTTPNTQARITEQLLENIAILIEDNPWLKNHLPNGIQSPSMFLAGVCQDTINQILGFAVPPRQINVTLLHPPGSKEQFVLKLFKDGLGISLRFQNGNLSYVTSDATWIPEMNFDIHLQETPTSNSQTNDFDGDEGFNGFKRSNPTQTTSQDEGKTIAEAVRNIMACQRQELSQLYPHDFSKIMSGADTMAFFDPEEPTNRGFKPNETVCITAPFEAKTQLGDTPSVTPDYKLSSEKIEQQMSAFATGPQFTVYSADKGLEFVQRTLDLIQEARELDEQVLFVHNSLHESSVPSSLSTLGTLLSRMANFNIQCPTLVERAQLVMGHPEVNGEGDARQPMITPIEGSYHAIVILDMGMSNDHQLVYELVLGHHQTDLVIGYHDGPRPGYALIDYV